MARLNCRFPECSGNHPLWLHTMNSRKIIDQCLAPLLFNSVSPGGGMALRQPQTLPDGFVYLDEVIPDILLDLRYCSADNFIGERIDGYLQQRGILTREAANALAGVQAELKTSGLGLKIFDAYRPQQAVDHFKRWAADASDVRMKAQYYPELDKHELLLQGYIAVQSSHTRGSTVDLGIVNLLQCADDPGLDMGSHFDYFGPESWSNYTAITPQQCANRRLLRELMMRHGFIPFEKEWWHFTLGNEPFPDSYFNFPVM